MKGKYEEGRAPSRIRWAAILLAALAAVVLLIPAIRTPAGPIPGRPRLPLRPPVASLPRDPFVIETPAWVDPQMVVPAREEIDPEMVVHPETHLRGSAPRLVAPIPRARPRRR